MERLEGSLRPHVVAARSDQARLRLAQAGERMDRAFGDLVSRRKVALSGAWRVAASLDPRQVLERGYAIVRGADNTPITRAEDLKPGTAFEVEFAHGHRRAAIATEGDGEAPRLAKPHGPQVTLAPETAQGDLF